MPARDEPVDLLAGCAYQTVFYNREMPATRPTAISIDHAIERLTFLPDRTPERFTDEASFTAYNMLGDYRDGAVFVGHWAGQSEWERHSAGDELVMVIDGATTISLLTDGEEHPCHIAAGCFVVVPQGVWHRFDTPDAVKLLTVTPQPTDHQVDRPT